MLNRIIIMGRLVRDPAGGLGRGRAVAAAIGGGGGAAIGGRSAVAVAGRAVPLAVAEIHVVGDHLGAAPVVAVPILPFPDQHATRREWVRSAIFRSRPRGAIL